MRFYVSANAIEELNTCKKTKILAKNGNETGGHISVYEGQPKTYSLFRCGETIWLDKLYLHLDCLRGVFTTHDCNQIIDFDFFYNGDNITAWTYKGGE